MSFSTGRYRCDHHARTQAQASASVTALDSGRGLFSRLDRFSPTTEPTTARNTQRDVPLQPTRTSYADPMPGGRPPLNLDAVIRTREIDGKQTDVTISDAIVGAVRAGAFVEHAAPAAGISKTTFYELLSTAARARIAHADDATAMTDHERRCCQFADAVEEARGQWIVNLNALHERLARGDFVETTTTTKYGPDGKVIEKTERETPMTPSQGAIEWRLTRAAPHVYAPPERIEISGPDGEPIHTLSVGDRASALSELASKIRGPKRGKRQAGGRSTRSGADDVSAVAAADAAAQHEHAPVEPAPGRSARPPKKKPAAAKTAAPKPTRARQRRAARRKDDDE